MPIKVLIVDDSYFFRTALHRYLSAEPGITVVGTADNPYEAREQIIRLQPDVITLDIEMPKMDGLTFLKLLMKHHPVSAIIVSSLTPQGSALALDALRLGALDVICKPGTGVPDTNDFISRLIEIIKALPHVNKNLLMKYHHNLSEALQQKVRRNTTRTESLLPESSDEPHVLAAIGASTGGTQAIEYIVRSMPVASPPILVVQHMPEIFTQNFADRLNRISLVTVNEAVDGACIKNSHVYIAPGNKHMILTSRTASLKNATIRILDGPPVGRYRPSVDVLFGSIARNGFARNVMGIILTGMGCDGADGMCEMKKQGAKTIAQDEQSSIVFGMPAEAIRRGATDCVLDLADIPGEIIRFSENSH